eukprot:CAMPEP_0182798072 /NCGR_PEP_ID=MMETSP0006_2-20121128/1158_1 /TAXON_ID=97485 /ORGANISM="Prymnesium parvum, Strain Texoma1" /LENGTH=154 /DNA_ID=CAMNT_0024923171 /DNA_START=323 /DNA_END=784 /DNA_ORIENTATION=+
MSTWLAHRGVRTQTATRCFGAPTPPANPQLQQRRDVDDEAEEVDRGEQHAHQRVEDVRRLPSPRVQLEEVRRIHREGNGDVEEVVHHLDVRGVLGGELAHHGEEREVGEAEVAQHEVARVVPRGGEVLVAQHNLDAPPPPRRRVAQLAARRGLR